MSHHRRALITCTVCLLLVGLLAACGSSASEGTRRDTPDTGSIGQGEVLCGLHSIGDGPRFETLHEMVWASSLIAAGTVTEESEPFVTRHYGQPTYARDYQITVDTLVRGATDATTTLTLRSHGVDVDGCRQYIGDPTFTLGERVLLFLWDAGAPSADAPLLEPVMQSEGVWRIAHDRPLTSVLREIATVLRGQPPLGGMAIGTAVPVAVAPLWLDASDGVPDEPEIALGPTCSGTFATTQPAPAFVSATNLAWFSSVIVVGQVEARGAAYVISDGEQPVIATDVAIAAQSWIRGDIPDSGRITVRQLGGTVGDCTQVYAGEPTLAIGQMVLIFLRPDERGPVGSAQVVLVGQQQGVWPVAVDNTVSNDRLPGTAGAPRPLEEVIEEVVIGLHGAPPRGPLPLDQLVLEREEPFVGSYQQWSGLTDEQQYAAQEAAKADPRVMALLGERGYRVTQAALWGPSAGPQSAAIIAFAFEQPLTIEGEWFVRSYPSDACTLDALPAPDIVSYRATYSGITEVHALIRLSDDLLPIGVEAMEPFGKGGEELQSERDFTSAATDIVACGR